MPARGCSPGCLVIRSTFGPLLSRISRIVSAVSGCRTSVGGTYLWTFWRRRHRLHVTLSVQKSLSSIPCLLFYGRIHPLLLPRCARTPACTPHPYVDRARATTRLRSFASSSTHTCHIAARFAPHQAQHATAKDSGPQGGVRGRCAQALLIRPEGGCHAPWRVHHHPQAHLQVRTLPSLKRC